jgi:tetrahedral aminopeptidase
MAETSTFPAPRLGAPQFRLLERLCNASAVSGNEAEVRQIVLEQVRPYASQLKVDALGNVLAIRTGSELNPGSSPAGHLATGPSRSPANPARLRVMVAAHMDEVGLILTNDEEGGLFRFEAVGDLEVDGLVGKSLLVGSERLPGVIGIKPIHLAGSEERSQKVKLENLRIDVSPGNSRKAKVGDWAVFSTPFARLGPSLCAKALDDRLGVFSLIELFKSPLAHLDLLAAFTVQEEIGYRGARVAAHALAPDLAVVLDCTPARDLPVLDRSGAGENILYNTRLGSGPAIYVADRGTLSDPRLVRHLVETAEALGIPFQVRQPGSDGTDASAIHKQLEGIPTVSLSVPARYLHTAASICRIEDLKNSLRLVSAALARLTPDVLTAER